ncbi:MAG: LytTR family transcriptional regulator DNA-binding domain-containing protein [Balneola sp.]
MKNRILIIEDDPLIAGDIKEKLESLDYEVIGITDSKKKALSLVKEQTPQLILSDIILETQEYDGIDVVKYIFEFFKIPVIYLTASSELTTVKKATSSQPAAFLLKPYRLKELAVNIELCLNSYQNKDSEDENNILPELAEDSIFIPENFIHHRVYKKDIFYVEADGSYTQLHTKKKKYQLTLNLKHFALQLGDPNFIRISRKHLVNIDHISKINGNTLYLDNDAGLTISKSNRQELLERFPILKTR